MMFFAGDDLASTYMTPKVLSIAHVLILGWVTMIIFGALYQLIPVVMEVKLYSEKLAMASFITLGIGTPMMAYSFLSVSIFSFFSPFNSRSLFCAVSS